jgi:hypothetical protein
MKQSTVEIGTILSHRTKEGRIEFQLNGEKTQLDIPKAREIHTMLGHGIEAAISDQLMFEFLTKRVGLGEEQAAAALLDFREMRQGSREAVFPQ